MCSKSVFDHRATRCGQILCIFMAHIDRGETSQLFKYGKVNWIIVLLISVLSGCGGNETVKESSTIRVNPAPSIKVEEYSTSKPVPTSLRNTVLKAALDQMGRRYRWGGRSPAKGFDCSGLAYYSHLKAGIQLPRRSRDQLSSAKRVKLSNIQAGDLLFFKIRSNASHVGIYLGGREFIHSPSSGKRVARQSLDAEYWRSRLYAAGNYYP